jgi:hypothetical protein
MRQTLAALYLAIATLLSGNALAEPSSACTGQPLRKALVTAFPLRHPEQIRPGEFMGWAQLTGATLARRLSGNGRLRIAAAPDSFPFADAEMAPALERDAAGTPSIVGWAARTGSQYVLAGLLRDFGTAKNEYLLPERQLVVEAFVFDGTDGRLLARREFAAQVLLDGALPRNIAPGTRAFDDSRLGRAYHGLLAEIGGWAEASIACLPFPLRVTRVEERRIHLDTGRDSGLAVGTALSAGNVIEVGAAGSVVEIPLQRNPPRLKVGDVLYLPREGKP